MARKQNATTNNRKASNLEQVNMLTNKEEEGDTMSEQEKTSTQELVSNPTEPAHKVKKQTKSDKAADKAVKAIIDKEDGRTGFAVKHYGPEGATGQTVMVALNELYPLDATGIPSCKAAMRDLHKGNVENLQIAYRNQNNHIPPIRVVYSSFNRFVPYDGNHRWAALSRNLLEDLGLDPNDKNSIKDDGYIQAIKNTLVPCEVTNSVNGHPVTNRDLIQLAFTANFEHGLPTSTYGRTSYAIWLMEDARSRGETMTQQVAADAAGVSKQALSIAIIRRRDKESAKAKQPVDLEFLSEEDSSALDDLTDKLDVKEVEDKVEQAVKRFVSTAKVLNELFSEPRDLHSYMLEYVKKAKGNNAMNFVFEALGDGFDDIDESELEKSDATFR